MVRNEEKGKFSKINLGGFFRGVVYRGMCVGGMLGNKRQDRGKKFQGARNSGGEFLGEMQKRFFGGSVGGAVNPQKFQGGIF